MMYKYGKSQVHKDFIFNILIQVSAPVAQWVVHLTHTWLIPGSKHNCYKNPLVFADS